MSYFQNIKSKFIHMLTAMNTYKRIQKLFPKHMCCGYSKELFYEMVLYMLNLMYTDYFLFLIKANYCILKTGAFLCIHLNNSRDRTSS